MSLPFCVFATSSARDASQADDWVYLLDGDTGSVVTLNALGQVTRDLMLR